MVRALGIISLILLVVLGIGFFTGWFSFGTETRAGETEVRFRVHRGAIEDDFRAIGDKVREIGDDDETPATPAAAPTHETLRGDVVAVDIERNTLTIELQGGARRTLELAAGTAGELSRVRVGDRVELARWQGDEKIVDVRVISG